MKKVLYLMIIISANLNGQVATIDMASVAQAIENGRTMLEQLQKMNQLLIYQQKSFEALKKGDWEGILTALDYQVESFGEFNGFLGEFLEYEDFGRLSEYSNTEDFKKVFEASTETAKQLGKARDLARTAVRLGTSIPKRLEEIQKAYDRAANSTNTMQTLQANSMTLTLLGQTMNDMVAVTNAQIAYAQAKDDAEAARKALERLRTEEATKMKIDTLFDEMEGNPTSKQYQDRVNNVPLATGELK